MSDPTTGTCFLYQRRPAVPRRLTSPPTLKATAAMQYLLSLQLSPSDSQYVQRSLQDDLDLAQHVRIAENRVPKKIQSKLSIKEHWDSHRTDIRETTYIIDGDHSKEFAVEVDLEPTSHLSTPVETIELRIRYRGINGVFSFEEWVNPIGRRKCRRLYQSSMREVLHVLGKDLGIEDCFLRGEAQPEIERLKKGRVSPSNYTNFDDMYVQEEDEYDDEIILATLKAFLSESLLTREIKAVSLYVKTEVAGAILLEARFIGDF